MAPRCMNTLILTETADEARRINEAAGIPLNYRHSYADTYARQYMTQLIGTRFNRVIVRVPASKRDAKYEYYEVMPCVSKRDVRQYFKREVTK